MAEVLAAPAAFAAVFQLASYGSRFARSLYHFAEDAGKANDDVEFLADRLRIVSSTISIARSTIIRHCSECPDSTVVQAIVSKGLHKDINRISKQTHKRLEMAKQKLTAIRDTKWSFIQALKWEFGKSSIMESLPALDLVQADLSLLMASTSMEALNKLLNSDTVFSKEQKAGMMEESKQLRGEIKNLTKTIGRLELKVDSLSRREENNNTGVRSSAFSTVQNQEALIELGCDMYRHGVVRGTTEDGPLTSVPKRSSMRSSTIILPTWFSERARPPGGTVSHPPASWNSFGRRSILDRDSSSSDGHSIFDGTPSSTESSSLPSPVSPFISEAPKREPPPPPPTTTTLAIAEESMTESTSGYVISSQGQAHHASPPISRILDGNIISIGAVKKFGLDVMPRAAGDKVVLDFSPGLGTRPSPSIGTVTLQWSGNSNWMNDKRRPPFAIECIVADHYWGPELIFGRPFLDARARLWPSRESTVD
ncbi:hypothetical protein B0H66DRAFT_629135 [Apodospora peruviana]|uniref:Fungal N-terminal domain-containing protein n=1 Tax=Apodospora peruviana TaxID=516989 RepID=A0AAE0LZ64_9PEZI|nr:hypothetical protein B0H66DRAFT_629135 [Apodospora peruviana]